MEYQNELRDYYENLCRHSRAGFITESQETALEQFVLELRDLVEEHRQAEERRHVRKAA